MIKLHMSKNRVLLDSPWREDIAPKCRSIAGANWQKTSRLWSFPLTLTTLRLLRELFGEDLRPDAELLAWARHERSQERALRRIGRRDDARLLRVPQIAPTLATAMAERTYQRVGAAWLARAQSGLIADEPGLGKTATTIAGIIEMGKFFAEHLVIAPKASLVSVWGRQLTMWTDGLAQWVAMPEGADKRRKALEQFEDLDTPKFLIINLAMVRRLYGRVCKKCEIWEDDVKKKKVVAPQEHYLQDHKWTRAIKSQDWPEILDRQWETVTLDESHIALAAYTSANITQQTAGLLDLKGHRIALTGTPLRGQERRIWGTFDWLGVKTGGYWGFVDTFMEQSNNGFGKVVHGLDPARADEFYRVFDRYVLRRTRSEVRKDLPLGQMISILVDMPPAHKKQYEEFERLGEYQIESGLVSSLGTLSELTRLKQMAFGMWRDNGKGKLVPTGVSPKFDKIVEMLRERGVTGDKDEWFPEEGVAYKYVISSHLSEIVDAMETMLNKAGIKTLKITGSVTGRRRNEAVDTFQSRDKEYRVMLLNTITGGASIELDQWCDEMFIIDETWVADDQVQLMGRTNNRSGAVRPRTWYFLRTAGTIEEKIAEGNWMQMDLQHKLLDGRRGVNLALHLLGKEVR